MLASKLETFLNSEENLQGSEVRYITDKVTWQHYETLLTQLEDSLEFRLTYLDGILEVMSPSRNHESIKTRIGTLLEIYFLETNTEYYIFYKFRSQDTNRVGRYEGEFFISIPGKGVLKTPIREPLFINVKDSIDLTI